jgi:hypothetical protein
MLVVGVSVRWSDLFEPSSDPVQPGVGRLWRGGAQAALGVDRKG